MKSHWHCVTFGGPNGFLCSTYCGTSAQVGFSLSWIEERKKYAAPNMDPKNLVLLNIIYLGVGTKEEFEQP